MNKKLLVITVLLIPITIISFFFKETNFYVEKSSDPEPIYVPVKINDEIKNIELEEYIIGVVAGEMPALFEEDALRAQSIASRTYAINHLKRNTSITNTISDQVYITEEEMHQKWLDKFDTYYKKIKDSVLATKGKIMLYNNEPIKAYYYSMSNGYTESSLNVFNEHNDYLNIVPSPYDVDNSNVINISKQEFCSSLDIPCSNISISKIKKDESNRVSTLTINNKEFTGIEVRKKLSLRSTDFTIIDKNDYLEITTKGYGHGVGMSQHGANNMAKLGFNYEEILKYYYQNVEISSI